VNDLVLKLSVIRVIGIGLKVFLPRLTILCERTLECCVVDDSVAATCA
jgi:hypothetical protein